MTNEDDIEYREDAAQQRHEQRYIPWVDPRDPNYIAPEEDDA